VADANLYAPPALMRIRAAHLRRHDWGVIEDAGHTVAGEQPAAFDEAVLWFLCAH
jgi:pimeloyl-ACP methyl ester carboxylesterase